MSLTNGYRQGFEVGEQQAREGKSQDIRPPLGRAIVSPDSFSNTYSAGVRDGYLIEMAKRDK